MDDRRKAVGLPPLAEYLKFAEEAMREFREQGGNKPGK